MKLPLIAGAVFSMVLTVSAYAQSSGQQRYSSKYRSQGSAEGLSYTRWEEPSLRYSLEPVAGVNTSNFTGVEGKNGVALENLTGYQAGVGFLLGKDQLWFDTGLLYAERGAQITGIRLMDAYTTLAIKVEMKYLEVPLLARYTFQNPRRSHMYIRGGAVAGLIQDAKLTLTNVSNMPLPSNPSTSVKDDVNPLDLRVLIGGGGALRMSSAMSFLLQVDYQMSVMKINKGDFMSDLDVYNSSLSGMLGVAIKI